MKRYLLNITENETMYSVATVIIEGVRDDDEAIEVCEAMVDSGIIDLGTYETWELSFEPLERDVTVQDFRLYRRFSKEMLSEYAFA